MDAAYRGHGDIVKYLHQAGADINISKNGWTAVMNAAHMDMGHGNIVKYLRSAGAN